MREFLLARAIPIRMIVDQLWRYPVKSMRGERLEWARLAAGGIEFDRHYALIDLDSKGARTFLSARQEPALLRYAATVENGDALIHAPDGSLHKASDARFVRHLEESFGRRIACEHDDSGEHHDAHDVLVITTASLDVLAGEWNAAVHPLRFRPNVILAAADGQPFSERAWVGERFMFGDAIVEAVSACTRCVVTTIDPETGRTDPSLLKLIVQRHDRIFGTYCRVVRPGTVRQGDVWKPCAS